MIKKTPLGIGKPKPHSTLLRIELTKEDFKIPGNVIQLGVPPVRIDIITTISGVSWSETKKGAVEEKFLFYLLVKMNLSKIKNQLIEKKMLQM